MKRRMLVVQLWGMGDVALTVPFLRTAASQYEVTLLAKSHAKPLLERYCSVVDYVELDAPWTRFAGKYRLYDWPWGQFLRTVQGLRKQSFDLVVSGRLDPREHLLMRLLGAGKIIGFPRSGSQLFLSESLDADEGPMHALRFWELMQQHLGLTSENEESRTASIDFEQKGILVHTGAAQAVRVWDLKRYQRLVAHLREKGYRVQVVCDASQLDEWRELGKLSIICPQDLDTLFSLYEQSACFIGNDSGPGHLAALEGLPTFTIFGPQLPELFAPQHPQSRWVEGAVCPHKPCFDSCRFATPHCIDDISFEAVSKQVDDWLLSLKS